MNINIYAILVNDDLLHTPFDVLRVAEMSLITDDEGGGYKQRGNFFVSSSNEKLIRSRCSFRTPNKKMES
ncbi:hypothetical protein [Peptoniphilus asaccharolyticus]